MSPSSAGAILQRIPVRAAGLQTLPHTAPLQERRLKATVRLPARQPAAAADLSARAEHDTSGASAAAAAVKTTVGRRHGLGQGAVMGAAGAQTRGSRVRATRHQYGRCVSHTFNISWLLHFPRHAALCPLLTQFTHIYRKSTMRCPCVHASSTLSTPTGHAAPSAASIQPGLLP